MGENAALAIKVMEAMDDVIEVNAETMGAAVVAMDAAKAATLTFRQNPGAPGWICSVGCAVGAYQFSVNQLSEGMLRTHHLLKTLGIVTAGRSSEAGDEATPMPIHEEQRKEI